MGFKFQFLTLNSINCFVQHKKQSWTVKSKFFQSVLEKTFWIYSKISQSEYNKLIHIWHACTEIRTVLNRSMPVQWKFTKFLKIYNILKVRKELQFSIGETKIDFQVIFFFHFLFHFYCQLCLYFGENVSMLGRFTRFFQVACDQYKTSYELNSPRFSPQRAVPFFNSILTLLIKNIAKLEIVFIRHLGHI